MFFTALSFTFTTSLILNWAAFLLWLSLFIPSGAISPLFSSSILGTYWPGGSFFSVMSFCLFILFLGFQDKNAEVVCHSILQPTMFCQISPPWPIHLGWPYMSRFIVSLSYTKLWSTWSFCLELRPIILKLFQKIEIAETLLKSFYETAIILMLEPYKGTRRKLHAHITE